MIFIHGNGGFAEELEVYLKEQNPAGKIIRVTLSGEDGTVSIDEYKKLAAHASGSSINYLGSGKCSIKARMAKSIIGDLGPAVLLNCVSRAGSIGDGSVVADMAVLGAKCRIGSSVLINYGASVGHHAAVGDCCVLAPHVALGGFCRVDAEVYIGAGAMVREHLTIGRGSTIGMGAVVTKDVPPDCMVIGVNRIMPQKVPREW